MKTKNLFTIAALALLFAVALVSPNLFAASSSCLTVTCPANKSVPCGSEWSFDTPVVFANCDCVPPNAYTITVVSTVTNGLSCRRNATRTWGIYSCVESNSCSQTVQLLQTNPPVFQGVADLSPLSCTNTQVSYKVTATEACCGNLTVTCYPPSGSSFPPGVTSIVTCITTDCCDRDYSTSFSVFPRLMTNEPVFQGAENIVLSSCTSTQVYYNVTAAEPLCGALPVTCSPPSGFTFPAGSVTFVECSVTDCCGRNYNKEFYVYPIQPNIIVAYCTEKHVAFGDTNWTFDPPSVYDSCCPGNCSFFPQPPITNQASGLLIITQLWGVTDSCGESNYCTQTAYVTNGFICPANNQAGAVASAGSSLDLFVPRQNPSQEPPVLDGAFSTAKYAGAWRFSHILYHPVIDPSPAQVNLLSTTSNLFICVPGLPTGAGASVPFVSVAFDTTQTGGQVASQNHLVFTMFENGNTQVLRGDGSGCFVPADLAGWGAAQTSQGASQWTAEFQIPLSLLGGGAPGSALGFHISHNDLRFAGDNFSWPFDARIGVPDTWGHLRWLGASAAADPNNFSKVLLDQKRITQGLEVDVTAGQAYLKTAGKDTLVRVQLYTLGPAYEVSSFDVLVHPSDPASQGTTIHGDSVGPGRVNGMPFGAFVGVGIFQAWIDGAALAQAGEYRFTASVTLAGSATPQLIDLGTETFYPTRNLHLVVNPSVNPAESILNKYDPSLAQWDFAHLGNLWPVLQDVNRMYPHRTGIALVTGDSFPAAGLDFVLMSASTCPLSNSDANQLFGDCDRYARTQANDFLNRWNAAAGTASQIDRAVICSAAKACLGGQEQDGWSPPTSGVGFDADPLGSTAVVFAQELAHSFGEVQSYSANSDPQNTRHSIHGSVPLYRNLGGVNMLTHQDIATPHSDMYPTFNPLTDHGYNTFMEGFEWNGLGVLETVLEPPPGREKSPPQPLFYLVGDIDVLDNLHVDYSQRVDDLPLALTPPNPSGLYQLVFLDAQQPPVELSQLPFDVSFGGTLHDDDAPPTDIGLLLAAPLPAGTARVEVRKLDTVLFATDVSAAAPVVANVVATVSAPNKIDLSWDSSDADSAQLTHNVFYRATPTSRPMLLAHGLTGHTFSFSTDLVPATAGGKLLVETSDGFNIGQGASQPFVIADKPPVAAISWPTSNAVLVANWPFYLKGSGFDVTVGGLTGSQLEWRDTTSGAFFGNGERLLVALPAGPHVLTCQATAPSGLTASTAVTVNVLADEDGDGLPDVYENQHPCLLASVADANSDPDGDGLPSWFEMQIGTDPCSVDTDNDGISDFDEIRLGSDPLDPTSKPLPNLLYLAQDQITLGPCSNGLYTVIVRTAQTSPSVTWKAVASAPWLEFAGGGQGDGVLSIMADCKGLTPGKHTAEIVLTATGGQTRIVQVETEAPAPAAPVTRTVTTLEDGGAGSLRDAIAASATGDAITFSVNGTITLVAELVIDKSISITGPTGPCANLMTISGGDTNRVFHITGGASQIANLRITHGHVAGGGGGILMDGGSLSLSNCAISDCYSFTTGGGGIYVGPATLALVGCTVSGNGTAFYGGGLMLYNGALVSLLNSTVSGNGAFDGSNDDAWGGGIFVYGSTLDVFSSTIANNTSATAGGGIYRYSGTVTVGNSLIARNNSPIGPDCKDGQGLAGAFVSSGYNLIGNTSGSTGFGSTGDRLNLNPLIGPLADNGGPTFTHALLPGSPAIDAGASFGVTTDQRGRPRPYDFANIPNASGGDGSDIGAFEADSFASGVFQYAVIDLGTLGGNGTDGDPFDPGSAPFSINNSGQIVGEAYDAINLGYRAVFWTNSSSKPLDLGTLYGSSSQATWINDHGQIVGDSDLPGDQLFAPAIWANSSAGPVALANFGVSAVPLQINTSGQSVGYTYTDPGYLHYRAIYWPTPGAPSLDLGTLGGTDGEAYSISDSGQIVGSANPAGSTSFHAAFWSDGNSPPRDMGTLGYQQSRAFSINRFGQIVGVGTDSSIYDTHAIFWPNANSDPVNLATPGSEYSGAGNINALGQIVGFVGRYSTAGPFRAVLWPNSASPAIDLNTLIPVNSGWVLQLADAVNDSGQIVGVGTFNGHGRAFALVPSGPALLITCVTKVGDGLQLCFTSQSCHTYIVLSASDLASAAWNTLQTGIPGNGGIVQVTIPNAFVQPPQFYRIQQAQ